MSRTTTHDARTLALLAATAVALRLAIFLGRGHYVAFDEGWYLLLGRNVFSGEGFTLSGLRHTTLSPLFPLIAGLADLVIGDAVWSGRIVAAIAGGLLVVPCWLIFQRLAGRRTALVACVLVAVAPTLAPFGAAFWVGWDLWVGAEPLMHLFLYTALALVLAGLETDRWLLWVAAGVAFGLAYLARPEAVIVLAVTALLIGAVHIARNRWRSLSGPLVLVFVFALTSVPYWLYLHDVLGQWSLSGRSVELAITRSGPLSSRGGESSSRIEAMLWENTQHPYLVQLYGLDHTRVRLASGYWGRPVSASTADNVSTSARAHRGSIAVYASNDGVTTSDPRSETRPVQTQVERSAERENASLTRIGMRDAGGRWSYYLRALGRAVPIYIWPLILIGLVGRRRVTFAETLIVLPVAVASIAIARIVAADPRTQLFVVPLAVYYTARGIRLIGAAAHQKLSRTYLRRRFVPAVIIVTVVLAFLATEIRWVANGITMGSPHHVRGTANKEIGTALSKIVPIDQPVMSWHPSVALFAQRDWRVLPYASFEDIVRYASAIGCETVVFSAFYPGSQYIRDLPQNHLVLRVPSNLTSTDVWSIDIVESGDTYVVGRVRTVGRALSETRDGDGE